MKGRDEISEPQSKAARSAYDRAGTGDKGHAGTLHRLAWLYLHVDASKIPKGSVPSGRKRWSWTRFPTTMDDVIETLVDAKRDNAIRAECERLARWASDDIDD